jgi:hypothetical protein
MYLLTWTEREAKVEASLGGRVTVEEMIVLYDEIQQLATALKRQPYLLLLDYSKAKRFDTQTHSVLDEIKDFCLANGADKIISVIRDEDDLLQHTHARFQLVLEGREAYIYDSEEIKWKPAPKKRSSKAA